MWLSEEQSTLPKLNSCGVVPSEGYSQKIAGPFRIANEILSQGKRGRDSDLDGDLDQKGGSRGHKVEDVYEKIVTTLEEAETSTKQPKIEHRERLTGPIDTLRNLCVRRLVDLIDLIDDLEGVHSEDLARLATALGKARKFDHRAALLVAVPSTEALYLPECSMIQEKSLMKAIEQVRGGKTGTSPLYSLRLQNCGHSMSNKSAQTLTALC